MFNNCVGNNCVGNLTMMWSSKVAECSVIIVSNVIHGMQEFGMKQVIHRFTMVVL